MGCYGKPTDPDANHSYRLNAIPLTRYPLTSIRVRGFSEGTWKNEELYTAIIGVVCPIRPWSAGNKYSGEETISPNYCYDDNTEEKENKSTSPTFSKKGS